MIPMPDDYTVRLVDLPVSVGGRIEEGVDGHIDVYINARLSDVGQHTAAYHEWKHWLNGDLHSDRDIRDVEGRGEPPKVSRRLPPLMKARDLLHPPLEPKPKPKPAPRAAPGLTARQLVVLARGLAELDAAFFAADQVDPRLWV